MAGASSNALALNPNNAPNANKTNLGTRTGFLSLSSGINHLPIVLNR